MLSPLMALHAFDRGAAIQTDRLVCRRNLLLVALLANNIAMRPVQRETSRVVIESVDVPFRRRVAGGAIFNAPGVLKLPRVRVGLLVASAASGRRDCKSRRMFRARRHVAAGAGDFGVASIQTKPRLRVIERRSLFPVFGLVTGFAGGLGLMRIVVAAGAGERREMILAPRAGSVDRGQHRLCGHRRRRDGQRLVASPAFHRGVFPGEREARAGVRRDVEGRRTEAFLRMAGIAPVAPGRCEEFSGVRIVMALRAGQ